MNWLPALGSLGEARAKLARLRIRQLRYVSDTNDTARAKTEDSLNKVIGEINTILQRVAKPTITGSDERQLFGTLQGCYAKYLASHKQIETLVKSRQQSGGEKLLMGSDEGRFRQRRETDARHCLSSQMKGGASVSPTR